jgi:hypothetical protein
MRRISIRTLMAFVVVSAVGLAALRNGGELWVAILLLLALAAAGVAILGAALMRGREQAWWLGFVVFEGAYLVAALGPMRPELATTLALSYVHSRIDGESANDAILARIISLRSSVFTLKMKIRAARESPGFSPASNDPSIAVLLESNAVLDSRIRALESCIQAMRKPDSASVDTITPVLNAEGLSISRWRSVFPGAANLDTFQRVGHSLFALLAGLVGGTVALWFWERRKWGEARSAD